MSRPSHPKKIPKVSSTTVYSLEKSATRTSKFNFLESMVGVHFIILIIFNIVSKIKIYTHIDSGSYRELRSHGIKEAGAFGERKWGGGSSGLREAKNMKGSNPDGQDQSVNSK